MRVIKGLVIVMAVMIFGGLIAVVWSIFNLTKSADTGAIDTSSVAEPISEISLGLPAGCVIADTEVDGRRLAVRTTAIAGEGSETVDCERVYIVDLTRGQVISTVGR